MWSGDMKDIFIIVFATLSVCFAASYVLVLRQSIKLKRDVSKLFIEKTLLQEYVDLTKSTKEKQDSDDSVHKENFIKFLSDSRLWAFEYIEDVQKGLTKFVNDVDADISHFDEYGDALSMSRPDYPSMKNISKAYKELKTLLPEGEVK
jgi:translation elongation factor EF-Ts